jgi:hypothetical protein
LLGSHRLGPVLTAWLYERRKRYRDSGRAIQAPL